MRSMELSLLQLAIIALTIAVVLGCGIYAARSIHSAEGFSLGGRSAGVPLVAGSIAGTCVGGGATIGTAQLASTVGLSAWWFTIGVGLALIIMGVFYARPLRQSSLETIPQYLVRNYGKAGGVFTSVVSSLGILFSAVSSCLPGIYIIAAILAIPFWPAAGILLVLVACYAFFGGMKSAGVGGILKMVVIWVSMLIAGGAAGYAVLFQPEIHEALSADTWFNLFAGGMQMTMANLVSVIVGMICTQTYVQAIFSATTPKTASVGAFVAALISLPIGLPCAMIGMYMHAAHPEVPAILALPTFLLSYQPVVLGSIAMGGIMLSLIGSTAGLSLGIGTMLSRDIFCKVLHVTKSASELWLTRLLVLATIVVASVIAVLNEGSQVLFWSYLSMALRGGGIFLPLTIAVFVPRAIERHWAIASMVLSTGAALAANALGVRINPLFVGLAVSVLLIVPGMLHRRRRVASIYARMKE